MKIALIAGSTRKGSINAALVQAMAQHYRASDDETTVIDLKDYDMPIYNGDYEETNGVPKTVIALAAVLAEQDAVFVASPEYNGSLTPLMKNTIDWLTRTENRDHITQPVWSIGACTMGPMSGIMVMRQMQYIMNRIHCDIVPTQLGVGTSGGAFNEDGSFARSNDISLADQQIAAVKLRVRQRQAVPQ